MEDHIILGIDVGGTAIKGALVDLEKGKLITERLRIETPQPAKPKTMAKVVGQIVRELKWDGGAIGCGFPAIIKQGVARSAANIDPSWIGTSIEDTFGEAAGVRIYAINDADAAGLAAMQFGVGKGRMGTVVLITIGTGLGSAVFVNGRLVPNTELGHVYLKNGKVAEKYAEWAKRKLPDFGMEKWANRFNKYLKHLERVFSPDLFILGGGGSNRYKEFESFLDVETEVVPAGLRNRAGIVGAAYHAYLMREHLPE